MIEFFQWFFGLELDSVTLPWLEANKYTIGFILGAPVFAYRWYQKNVKQIHQMRDIGNDTPFNGNGLEDEP